MKKILMILVLNLLFFGNANALPKWLGDKPYKVCRVNQDIALTMNWREDDGSWEMEPFSLKKGDYLGLYNRKGKDQKWYAAS